MSDFKVGDKVRIKSGDTTFSRNYAGYIGYIAAKQDDSRQFDWTLSSDIRALNASAVYESEIELVPDPNTTTTVRFEVEADNGTTLTVYEEDLSTVSQVLKELNIQYKITKVSTTITTIVKREEIDGKLLG